MTADIMEMTRRVEWAWYRRTRNDSLRNRVLDALDNAATGAITGDASYIGPLSTVQSLAAAVGCSDSAVRESIHALRIDGLVQVFDALDPHIGRRRLYVTGSAA